MTAPARFAVAPITTAAPTPTASAITSAAASHSNGIAPHTTTTTPRSSATAPAPLVIGITGASGSGKSTVASELIRRIEESNLLDHPPYIVHLALDRFYRNCTPDELANITSVNFDHVDRFEWPLFRDTLHALRQGQAPVELPRYSFVTHKRLEESDTISQRADVIIVEGLFILFDQSIRELIDLRIYVDTDSDECLARRIKRDIIERGRNLDSVLHQYFSTVKPGLEHFIFPTRRYAHIILPNNHILPSNLHPKATTASIAPAGDLPEPSTADDFNHPAMELLTLHLQTQLQLRNGVSSLANCVSSKRSSHADDAA